MPYWVSAADDAQADELEKYGMPPDVPATVKASVPLVVTGDPPTETIPPVKVCATEETVPAEAALLARSLTVPVLFLMKEVLPLWYCSTTKLG